MKKTVILSVAAIALLGDVAEARKMSMMEWMDPKSMEIWQSLSEQEKIESVTDYLAQQQTGEDKLPGLEAKVKACIDKEVAGPDYKGTQVPLIMPYGFCSTKYSSILSAQKK